MPNQYQDIIPLTPDVWRQTLDLVNEQLLFLVLKFTSPENRAYCFLAETPWKQHPAVSDFSWSALCSSARTASPCPSPEWFVWRWKRIHLLCPEIPNTLVETELWHVVVDLGERPEKCSKTLVGHSRNDHCIQTHEEDLNCSTCVSLVWLTASDKDAIALQAWPLHW